MGTLILTDAPATGENLEYIDKLLIPVSDGLAFRFNAYSNIESFVEPNGAISASLLEDINARAFDAIGRNSAMSGGVVGGGIITPASESELNGRPYLNMANLATDGATRGRWYLVPAAGRAMLSDKSGYTIMMVASMAQAPTGSQRLYNFGPGTVQAPTDGYLQVGTGSARTYFIRATRTGGTPVQASSTEAYTFDQVMVFTLTYDPLTGVLILYANDAAVCTLTLADTGATAWPDIYNFRLCGAPVDGTGYGNRGKFADFLAYTKVLSEVERTKMISHLRGLYGI